MTKFIYVEPGIELNQMDLNIEPFISKKDLPSCFIKVLSEKGRYELDEEGTLHISVENFEKFFPIFLSLIEDLKNPELTIEVCIDRFTQIWNNGEMNEGN